MIGCVEIVILDRLVVRNGFLGVVVSRYRLEGVRDRVEGVKVFLGVAAASFDLDDVTE